VSKENQYYLHQARMFLHEFAEQNTSLSRFSLLADHIKNVLDWLNAQPGIKEREVLVALVLGTARYFTALSTLPTLIEYLPVCMEVSQENPEQQVRLLILSYQARFMAGNWKEAKEEILKAVELAEKQAPNALADVFSHLGTLEINQGNFQPALKHINQAMTLYRQSENWNAYYNIISQEASYYIDHDGYEKAEEIYQEIERYEIMTAGKPSSHTLQMSGVISRRLGKLSKASAYLQELAQRGIDAQSTSEIATAIHHLAWIKIDQNELEIAQAFGIRARQLYQEIHDPRGVSDEDEQLGEIAYLQGQYEQSKRYLKAALTERKELENKVGLASARRRLSKAYFANHEYFAGGVTLARSASQYLRLGMMNRKRIRRWLRLK
jgi:tetratricopeptide (TPR) repeat protein